MTANYGHIGRRISKDRVKEIEAVAEARPEEYVCQHCRKRFVKENRFLEHQCEEMRRADEMKTIVGISAKEYYEEWFRALRRKTVITESMFMKSHYYKTFVTFSKFVQQTKLHKPKKFIKFAVSKNYAPAMWTATAVYMEYMDFLDTNADPLEQTVDSVYFILKYCDSHNIPTAEFFEHLDPNELIQMIQQRQLYPWILLMSDSFTNMLEHRVSEEQRSIIESLLRIDYWQRKLTKHEKDIPTLLMYVEELGI